MANWEAPEVIMTLVEKLEATSSCAVEMGAAMTFVVKIVAIMTATDENILLQDSHFGLLGPKNIVIAKTLWTSVVLVFDVLQGQTMESDASIVLVQHQISKCAGNRFALLTET